MTTTFESIISPMSYQEGVTAISMTLLDLVDHVEDVKMPLEFETLNVELRETATKIAIPGIESKSFADIDTSPSSPQAAAAKMLRVFRTLDGLLNKTCGQAASVDPVAAIQLLALKERMAEESIVLERYVWLGRTEL